MAKATQIAALTQEIEEKPDHIGIDKKDDLEDTKKSFDVGKAFSREKNCKTNDA